MPLPKFFADCCGCLGDTDTIKPVLSCIDKTLEADKYFAEASGSQRKRNFVQLSANYTKLLRQCENREANRWLHQAGRPNVHVRIE